MIIHTYIKANDKIDFSDTRKQVRHFERSSDQGNKWLADILLNTNSPKRLVNLSRK